MESNETINNSYKDMTYLIYTHSDYEDVLIMTLDRLKQYFNIPITICTNDANLIKKYTEKYNICKTIEYVDSLPYSSKLLSVLDKIETSYVLLNHDNNILCDFVNCETIHKLIEIMGCDNIDLIRLSTSGIYNNVIKSDDPLIKSNTGPYYLSVCPTIWKKNTLKELCSVFKSSNYRNFEKGESQNYAKKLKNFYISGNNGRLYSKHYPCAHVTLRGKWILSPELKDMIREYSIDINIRGINS